MKHSEPQSGPGQQAQPRLSPVQEQTEALSLSYCGRTIVSLLSMNAAQLGDYLRKEADKNPCVELTFPEAPEEEIERLSLASADYRDDLLLQLPESVDQSVQRAAQALIAALDESGYLPFDPIRAAAPDEAPLLKRALRLVQSLEPAGVGARSLRECYRLQLNRAGTDEPDAKRLVADGETFRLVKKNEPETLCMHLGWAMSRLNAALRVLSRLPMHPVEPHPGEIAYAVPDAEILHGETGYAVRLLDHALPSVSLNTAYVDSLQAGGGGFAGRGIYYANRLIYCLSRRNATLLSLLQYAVDRQGPFLSGGTRVRVTMREAAKALDLNPSTVSRALSDKYVQFGQTVFSASFLFPRGGTGDVSPERAAALIRELIEAESGAKPLSDQRLAALLHSEYGIPLSRRTVAKYRRTNNIASSAERERK